MNCKIMLLVLSCLPLLTEARQESSGIEFEQNLTLTEAKIKARSENKYIFVDCYASWCGPCKRMDKEVYKQDSVGEIFSNKFVSLKIQMDSTATDEESTKGHYEDAVLIAAQFKVNAYPTFLFFAPDGNIVGKEVGFKNANEFIAIAKDVIRPGKKYIDPYSKYDQLLADYRKGKKDYKKMPYIVNTAKKLSEGKLVDSLTHDYFDYLLRLNQNDLYTKENIEFIASNIRDSKQKVFELFYPDGSMVEKIMNERGFSQRVVDRVIRIEITSPFLEKVKDSSNMNWEKQLSSILRERYPKELAQFALLSAKIKWYQYKYLTTSKNIYREAYFEHFVFQVRKYGIDRANISLQAPSGVSHEEERDLTLNGVAWDIFSYSKEKDQINAAIKWMQGVVTRSKYYNPGWEMSTKDTYANLLYKANRGLEAINLEREVVEYAKKNNDENAVKVYQKALDKMINGEPTWE